MPCPPWVPRKPLRCPRGPGSPPPSWAQPLTPPREEKLRSTRERNSRASFLLFRVSRYLLMVTEISHPSLPVIILRPLHIVWTPWPLTNADPSLRMTLFSLPPQPGDLIISKTTAPMLPLPVTSLFLVRFLSYPNPRRPPAHGSHPPFPLSLTPTLAVLTSLLTQLQFHNPLLNNSLLQ